MQRTRVLKSRVLKMDKTDLGAANDGDKFLRNTVKGCHKNQNHKHPHVLPFNRFLNSEVKDFLIQKPMPKLRHI